ncbi:MAG TPA: serine O-acetyltransferase [Methylomirabilota bacterium]|jgi:serine O-acetyltransferase
MLETIRRDVTAAMERDPAVRSRLEVVLCYPGVHALAFHRLAHRLWGAGWWVTARFVSHVSRFLTGIEIHPGARIGSGVFIDHGMGLVIGETAEVGDDVTLYQGVTLGGTSLKREKRHPTLERDVVVGTGAAVIGAIRVGEGARIGAGSVVVSEVPPNSVVVGVPGKVIYRDGRKVAPRLDLEHADLPDPLTKAVEQMLDRIHALESDIKRLRRAVDQPVEPEARP